MSTGPRPRYDAERAVAQARALVGHGVYWLGTGDIDTHDDDRRDCFGFAFCELYGVRRHRPWFNRGEWSTVSDDLNCNSAIEDADHARELCERVTKPAPGVLLVYPTIRIVGHPQVWIGHVGIVVGIGRCLEWDAERPDYTLLDVVQCHGPNGRRPGIAATDGSVWDHHDATWPRPEHRTAMLRVLP